LKINDSALGAKTHFPIRKGEGNISSGKRWETRGAKVDWHGTERVGPRQ